MLPPDKLTSGSTTVVLAFELDSNGFNLGTNPSIVIQPDLTGSLLTGNQNSLGNHWFHHLDEEGPGYHYINLDGTRYYRYSDQSNVFCDPRGEGLVRFKSPSGDIESEVTGKGTILLVAKKSNNGLMLHLYSPLPMGKSQNDMYRKYVLESNLNL